MKKKLYVGNLSFQTTENELKDLFAQSGPVETVRIITDRDTGRPKGFGFVEMEEGADHAIGPTQRQGVQWARADRQRGKADEPPELEQRRVQEILSHFRFH